MSDPLYVFIKDKSFLSWVLGFPGSSCTTFLSFCCWGVTQIQGTSSISLSRFSQQQQLQAQHLSHGHGLPEPLTPHPSGLQPPAIPPIGSSAGLLALSSALGGQSHLPIKDEKKHHDSDHQRGEWFSQNVCLVSPVCCWGSVWMSLFACFWISFYLWLNKGFPLEGKLMIGSSLCTVVPYWLARVNTLPKGIGGHISWLLALILCCIPKSKSVMKCHSALCLKLWVALLANFDRIHFGEGFTDKGSLHNLTDLIIIFKSGQSV